MPVLATLPINPQTATLVDLGRVEAASVPEADDAFAQLKAALSD